MLVLARDVTAERQAAEAQRARETMLRLAQRAGGIGVFDWDLAAGTARCSAEFFAMFGLPELEGSMTAEQWNRYLHPLDRERMTAHLARALEGVEPAAADYRILTEDGRTRWLTYSGQLHHTPAGHLRLLGTVVDITARKDAEEELRRRDERYRAFVSTSNEAIWRFELTERVCTAWPAEQQVSAFFEYGYLAECNDAMAQMYGFESAQELVGVTLSDMMSPSVEANREFLRMFVESGYRLTAHESQEIDRNGRPKFFRNSLVGIVEGDQIARAWGTQTDITDLKIVQERESFLARASAALASSLDYRATLATMADLALSFLADWCAVDMFVDDTNVERLAMAHRDPDVLEAMLTAQKVWEPRLEGTLAEVQRTHQPLLIRRIADATLAESTRSSGQVALLHALGLTSIIVAPFVVRHRVLGAITLAVSGATRTYEDADVRMAEELAHRAAIAIDNARLFEEAQAASRAKDDFLARLSHELRTPLNAVLGWTLMLRGSTDTARVDRGLDIIDRNGRALTRIIEDLLDFSRNVRGGLRLEPVPTDLCDVAREAIASVEPVARQKGVSLHLTVEQVCMVAGDPARLQQVAWNLLTNAIKFTPSGGRVSVRVRPGAEGVQLRVRDTGEGIRPELLDAIFDPFRQGEPHGTPGLGLGLAIVRQIVEAHGGTVEARNTTESRGATFEVWLPSLDVDEIARNSLISIPDSPSSVEWG